MSYQDLITCSICLENFTKPRYLPCLHTYCEECLTNFISTAYDEDKNGFSCPNCRMFNKVEVSENISPKMAAVKFPINHMIMTLLDQRHKEINGVTCYSCSKRDRKASGKFWCYSCSAALCEACGEFHTSLPILADHRIAPLEEVKDVNEVPSPANDSCGIQTKQETAFRDDDGACCAPSAIVSDMKLDNKYTKTKESLVNEIQTMIDQFSIQVNNCTKEYELFETSAEIRTKEIQEFSSRLINHAEKLKTNFNQELAETKSKKIAEIQGRKKEISNMRVMLSNCERILSEVDKKCSKVQMLSLIPKISKLIEESNSKLENMKQNPISQNIEVTIDKNIEDSAIVETFGKLIET
nr:tripartite motif-containing protein 2-like [Crassostrea gigas]